MTPERWKRVEDLFHGALAVPPGERASFLAGACPDDAVLRRDVAALLAHSAESGGMLSDGAIPVPAMFAENTPGRHAGQVFGAYHLRALLGVGGMGEIYLAHDTRLGRDVAIKVLPAEFTRDSDRLARFEREARMLATLNHPNICGIYGLDEADGVRFLVLELVEGETLTSRLGDGRPLPVADALEIARQIAEALEGAHDRGIIHRDLKPSNVKITPAHVVKVLDFGLAKSVSGSGSEPNLTQVPTGATDDRPGTIVGTAAYMSPEQARGLAVDKRTDIWAFGVVLFEMLTGKRPFRGETATDTFASILRTDPNWGELPSSVPGLRRLLHRCLQKDPKRRLQSIAEARVQVESALRGGDDDPAFEGESAAARVRRSRSTVLTQTAVAWTVAAVAIAVAAALGLLALQRPDARPNHFFQPPPPRASLATEESPVISPDGVRLAFVGYDAGGTQRLYQGIVGAADPPQPLEKTEGASLPFWSPDSRALGFFAQGHLYTIDILTGGPRRLAHAPGPRGGTWSRDGVIVYVPSPFHGPYRVSAAGDGKDASPVSSEASQPRANWFPFFLPDGRHFLEFGPTVERPENPAVWLVSLESGTRVRLVDSRSNATYAQGHLFFWKEQTLWAQPFDEHRRAVSGSPRAVANAVGLNPVTNQGLFSVSATGTLAYFGGAVGEVELVWLDRDGHEVGHPGPTGVINSIDLSPDDTSVVYDRADSRTATFDLWRLVFGDSPPDKMTLNPSNDVFPVWSPDGNRIAFMSARERPPQVYELLPTSAGGETRMFGSTVPAVPTGWLPNGETLFYTAIDRATVTGDIWSVSRATGKSSPVVTTPSDERYATPSPDGRWLAYVSNESGFFEVKVVSLQEPRFERQISAGGGSQPQWRRDGRELVYMAPDRSLVSVDIQIGTEAFTTVPPRRLFRTRTKSFEMQGIARTFSMTRDGQRFLVANATEEAKSAYIKGVTNVLATVPK